MANYYGSLQGNRGEATRCGSRNSGLRVSCQTWNGSIITRVRESNDKDLFSIEMSEYSSCYGNTMLTGTYDEVKKLLEFAQKHRDEILAEEK